MRLLTDAILAVAEATGETIGDAEAPDSDRPYAVLWPLFTVEPDGSLAAGDLDTTGWWHYQVTSVGDTREQAEWLADTLTDAVRTATLTVTGYRTRPVVIVEHLPLERDDAVQPPVFYRSLAFKVFVTPSP